MILVIYVALVVPYRLGFGLDDTEAMRKFGVVMDLSFLIDVILTFFQEFRDDKSHKMANTHKEIAILYLKGWFLLDTLSIFPFEAILSGNSSIANVNSSLRIARVSKIYKMVRFVRLARLAKGIKKMKNSKNMK